MSFSSPFVHRPIGTTLLATALLLAGALAYWHLPVAPLPRVDFPTIVVAAALPGASPETMASSVATPLERRFGRISGLSEMTSTSSLGASNITLQFSLDKDVDAAARDVQAAINAAGGELPANLPLRPSFRKVNPADAPMLVFALTSQTLSLGEIYDAASTVLAQKISQVAGVGQVDVSGGQLSAVRVQLDPQVLGGMGLTMEDARTLLGQVNAQLPKGSFQGPHQAFSIGASDAAFRAADYRKMVLGVVGGAPVRLGDVGCVKDSVENNKLAAWFDHDRAILMMLRREPGANIIATIDEVLRLMPELMKTVPGAIDMHVAMNQSGTIRASVREIERTMLITVLLVIAVVFVFLQNIRATSIPSMAVPLSLVGTFAVMYLLGYSLDNLSLMALTISTGFVVDDAIVVAENIMRFLEAGHTPLQAALQGAKDIGFTVISITVSLLAVFIPLLMMQGIVGRLFHEFAVTLSIAIVVSAGVSLSVTPMMCAQLLRPHSSTGGAPLTPGLLAGGIEKSLAALQRSYGRGVRWSLAHARVMLVLNVAVVALTVYLFVLVPKGLFPQQDNGMIMAMTEGPQDSSFAAMQKLQQAAQQIILQDEAVAHAVSFIGVGNAATANTGTLIISLKPLAERRISADRIIDRLRHKLVHLAGVNVFLQAAQDIRIGGRSARTQFQYTLQDADLTVLKTWAPRVLAAFRKLPALRDVATDQQTGGLETLVSLDRDTAAAFGITPQQLDNTLYDAFGQRQVSTVFAGTGPSHVILEVLPALQQQPEAIDQLYLKGTGPGVVPMAAVTHRSQTFVPLSINHQGQFPSITLSFNLAPGTALGEAVTAIHAAQQAMGLPASVQADFQGTAQAFRATTNSMPWLILAALATVYIVLGVLYESFVHPLTILSTLPSAGLGALLAMLATGQEFGVMGLIAIILLIGIVKKNAIMMIDFAVAAQRQQQLTAHDAIYQACLMRFRPIMMTTLAALLGGVPLALGSGAGAELRRPLGIAIVGGLSVSQLLTLFTTPVVYLALERARTRRPSQHSA